MSELNKENDIPMNPEGEQAVEVVPSMDDFSELLNKSFKRVYVGDIVTCTVITVTEKELLVNLGYISDGVIPVTETFADENRTLTSLYHEGDVLKAEVIKSDDGDGNVLLSVKKAEAIIVWEELAQYHKEGTTFDVKIKEVVKGGVVCDVKGVRAFIPASLLSNRYVEDLTTFVGQTLKVKVSDFDPEKKKVVLSHKEIAAQEEALQRKRIFTSINKNDRFTGKVVKLMNYGAFVDIGGIQGLIHNQDLSWSKIKHPSDVVKEGDLVEVYVIDVDHKNEKVSLGLKDIKADPWDQLSSQFVIGKVYDGQVERITTYGAFVKLAEGVEGLVHISEMSEKRIQKPQEVVNVGDAIKVKVLNIEDKKIKLSMKNTDEEEVDAAVYHSDEDATTSLEDVFKVFLKDIIK